MKIKILIVDDEPLARESIRILLANRQETEVIGECWNGLEALKAVRHQKPDLVFLDIQMPDLDGFGLIKEVGIENMPMVIFVTAFDQYALQAFDVHAIDYLVKPYDKSRFYHALERAIAQIKNARSNDLNHKLAALLEYANKDGHFPDFEPGQKVSKHLKRLVIKELGRVYFVKTEEIDWIEASGDYVTLHLGKRAHLLHERMSHLEAKMDPQQFIRIHRSFIVNIDRVKELEPYTNNEYFVILNDGTQLKLSRGYRHVLNHFFSNSL